MKSVVIEGTNQEVRIDEVELDDPREDEVRIKMVASGVCHSDYSIIDGTIKVEFPLVLGHEGAGIVEEVGQHVGELKPGDHVVLSYVPQCGKCFYCTTGKPNLCETLPALWHRRESRRQRRKQTSSYSHGSPLPTRKDGYS